MPSVLGLLGDPTAGQRGGVWGAGGDGTEPAELCGSRCPRSPEGGGCRDLPIPEQRDSLRGERSVATGVPLGIPCSRCPACIFGFVPGQTPTNGIRAAFFGVCCDPLALSPPSFSLSRVKDGDFSSSPSLPSRALGKAPRLLGVGFGKGERRCCPIAGPICAAGIGSGDGEMR